MSFFSSVQHQSPEAGAEDLDRQQEFAAPPNPPVVIRRQAAAGNDAVQVGMKVQILFPCQALALRAVTVAAGAIADVRVLAVVAPFDDAAHGRSTAGFDGLHQAMLIEGQAMSLPVREAVLSKNVGQLQG